MYAQYIAREILQIYGLIFQLAFHLYVVYNQSVLHRRAHIDIHIDYGFDRALLICPNSPSTVVGGQTTIA